MITSANNNADENKDKELEEKKEQEKREFDQEFPDLTLEQQNYLEDCQTKFLNGFAQNNDKTDAIKNLKLVFGMISGPNRKNVADAFKMI